MVLVVDKNKDLLDCYKEFYSHHGLASMEFTNIPDAYSFFTKNKNIIRLISIDLSLQKKFDGLSLARSLKKISSIPIILITWSPLPADLEDDLFTAILTKPIDLEQLETLAKLYCLKVPRA